MILTAHQPGYLPWLGLFDKIARCDTFVSFNQAQYVPRDWQNRNRIKTANGVQWLTVPVLKHGHRDVPMTDIHINNQLPWQRKHWRTVELAYQKAPYFKSTMKRLRPFYHNDWYTLVAFNEAMLETFLDMLGLNVIFLRANNYDFHGHKSDLVLDMCKHLGASAYWFGGEGKDYADIRAFEAAEIQPWFQEYRHPEYPQLHGPFVSHLSVVDLLMNCGPDSLEILTNRRSV